MLSQTSFSDNPGKKRVTKEGNAWQVGLKSQDLTPRKKSLILVAQKNYKKVTMAPRRLRDANYRLKFMARSQESPKEVLNKVPLSQGTRLIFECDQRNFLTITLMLGLRRFGRNAFILVCTQDIPRLIDTSRAMPLRQLRNH